MMVPADSSPTNNSVADSNFAPLRGASARRRNNVTSLTGASLVEVPPSPSSHGHGHDHGHGHEHEPAPTASAAEKSGACPEKCCSARPPPVQLGLASVPLRQGLTTLFRSAPYEVLTVFAASDARLAAVLSAPPSQADEHGLRGLDANGHALAHWAAKRSDPRFLRFLADRLAPSLYPAAPGGPPFPELSAAATDDAALTPLHWAASDGNVATIAAAMALYGSDGARRAAVDAASATSGATALVVACQYGHATVAALLALRYDANVMARDNNRDTALHWAAYHGDVPTIALLCRLIERDSAVGDDGASLVDVVNSADAYKQTPVHLAALRGHAEALEFLLYSALPERDRADVVYDSRDHKESTPLETARRKRHHDVVSVLERLHAERVGGGRGALSSITGGFRGRTWREAATRLFTGGGVASRRGWPMAVVIVIFVLAAGTWHARLADAAPPGWRLPTHLFLVATGMAYLAVHLADPGTIDAASRNEEVRRVSADATRQYHAALDALANGDDADLPHMCHTCQIVRPTRSKHCRVVRKCVLVFDHFCPFVGNAVGLYNYRWFYLFLLCGVCAFVGWYVAAVSLLMHEGMDRAVLLMAVVIFFGLPPMVGLLAFHTQLVYLNMSTNEAQNKGRYKYLHDKDGQFHNPYNVGCLHNARTRICPSRGAFEVPEQTGEDEEKKIEMKQLL
eukprot:CAMPEP_0194332482 /NCGR_PEP_ID=MMETSP0171-20130528/59283_1 /TAXON_ID=218684 /ORGANISM="Corethron pennatum, Strain L29A3" /LENGTH=685 /DNA_ID=CAMNT_0039094355 /DNA_START=28 /DNA_END=2081 /DNA_ORIENTATION=-